MADANLLLVTAPGTPEFANLIINLQKDSSFLIGSEWIWLFVHFVLSVFLAIATILASAITHGGKKIAFRNLLSRAVRSWKRPFVTSLYTSIFGIGYFVLLLAILLPLVLIIQPPAPSSFTAIALAVLASVLYIYIAVFCILALVISVLEEMSGFEAVGKAAQILKGMKIQGLLLYLLPLLVSALVQGINYIPLQKSVATRIIIGLLVIIPNRLAGMYFLMTYTIFYYRCKKSHGEEVEFPGIEDQYAIIPTASVISDNIV
ncbi:unnamed protein product [Dovyalis caffra]|uniref:DUF4013 domain-containing protein n=1 Tax=Dovyalis caffra TaxID=77055 RepID=A0AAV1S3X9_9ROSI|nr:unnamed protein product [Dovyalis caffra]